MKCLSLYLTVACAAGLPLTASAFDYGPDQHMLAVEASAPSLPASRDSETPFPGLTASHHAHDDDDDGAAAPPSADNDAPRPGPPEHTARRSAPPATPAPAHVQPAPAHGHNVVSWQSLLPGSIQ